MPYIKQNDRKKIEDHLIPIDNPGELNFAFTWIILCYLARNGVAYQQCNDVIGALESCKLEFYRRQVAPYEDRKITENGDVYGA